MANVNTAHAQSYTLTTIATFNGSGNGAKPLAGVTQDASGNLYGTTQNGGANNDGTVYKIAAGTNTITTLATFSDAADGAHPFAGVTFDNSGNLYGTAYQGGTNNYGAIFKIAAGTNSLAAIVTFDGSNGELPVSGLLSDGNGNFYGTTYQGGVNGVGTVFKLTTATNSLTTLATFYGTSNGAAVYGGLALDSSGNLYGTTQQGGANNLGTVFKIAAGTNALTTLATFNGTGNGASPDGSLILDSNGNLYGTTLVGGASNDGTVFEIAAGTSTLTTLATFTGTANGSVPLAGLTLDNSGNLYGTTEQGGANSYGTVFKIAAGTHTLTTIATFSSASGEYPDAGLAIDSSGNLYGTTTAGGSSNNGTVFKLTPTGGAAAPEPSVLLLIAPGALGLLAVRKANKQRNRAA